MEHQDGTAGWKSRMEHQDESPLKRVRFSQLNLNLLSYDDSTLNFVLRYQRNVWTNYLTQSRRETMTPDKKLSLLHETNSIFRPIYLKFCAIEHYRQL